MLNYIPGGPTVEGSWSHGHAEGLLPGGPAVDGDGDGQHPLDDGSASRGSPASRSLRVSSSRVSRWTTWNPPVGSRTMHSSAASPSRSLTRTCGVTRTRTAHAPPGTTSGE